MVVFIYIRNSKFMVIKSDFFKSSSFLFLKNENEFENIGIPPPPVWIKFFILCVCGTRVISRKVVDLLFKLVYIHHN